MANLISVLLLCESRSNLNGNIPMPYHALPRHEKKCPAERSAASSSGKSPSSPQRPQCRNAARRLCLSNEDMLLVTDTVTGTSTVDSVFTVNDLIGGTIAALVLATTVSLLDNLRSDSTGADGLTSGSITNTAKIDYDERPVVFDSWEEMKNPDNYIWYKTQLRKRQILVKRDEVPSKNGLKEKRWVLFALIALFAPIFSIEFFLTVSRQVLCSGPVIESFELARQLCSPSYNM